MIVNNFYTLAANPFLDAYFSSDLMGKLIFLGLLTLSIATWVILIHKAFLTYQVRTYSRQFYELFQSHKVNPLGLEYSPSSKKPNPFQELYGVLKKHTIEILNKNRRFGLAAKEKQEISYISQADVDFVAIQLQSSIANLTKNLEKNLFILSTIVSLAPFLGLLGTVWGILTSFSEMQAQAAGSTNQMVLGGLSLALATTVLGLIDAIPALIGYNYLKNNIRDFETEMSGFSTEMLASVEMHYRQVNVL